MDSATVAVLLLSLLSFFLVFLAQKNSKQNQSNPKGFPLPPGPKPLPLIGNLKELPSLANWPTFLKLAKKYGDLTYFEVFGYKVIFLNTTEAANDFYVKRGSNYSDRPQSFVANEIAGWDWFFAGMRYDARWRKFRKEFHQHVDLAAENYKEYQQYEALRFVLKLVESPKKFMEHIRFTGGAFIVRMMYGIDIKDENDKFMLASEQAMATILKVSAPVSFAFDALPILRSLSHYIDFKYLRDLRAWKKLGMQEFIDQPFVTAKELQKSDSPPRSVVGTMMDSWKDAEQMSAQQDMKHVAASAYLAGVDTSFNILMNVILAMRVFPDVQRKARDQVDRVIGNSRLPTLSDRPSLPYVEAIVLEAFRWRPIVAFNHRESAADDEYRGFFIPKGTLIIGNISAILHNDEVYPNPTSFIPERFLTETGEINPKVPRPDASFGFGRRICPGKDIASNNAFVILASVLATIEIVPALDKDGKPIPVNAERPLRTLSAPDPFECNFIPRSKAAMSLIQETLEDLRGQFH